MRLFPFILILFQCIIYVYCFNFPYESIQLTDAEVQGSPRIAFGSYPVSPDNTTNIPSCRTYPGDPDWPSPEEWQSFNNTLGDVLLKPLPPAAYCYSQNYDATRCAIVRQNFANSTFHTNDPTSVVTQWPEGGTCLLPPMTGDGSSAPDTNLTCTTDGYPLYVVNVSTVRHVQLAVNFARNANLRLVIKNTGHDFLGKSLGGGSLSIWTHNLKSFEYLPSITIGNYTGKAARVGSGLQTYEVQKLAADSNVTILSPGGSTVGSYGGWMMGGGHSILTSMYGLGSDQILAIQVVTADGRLITVDPDNNVDLFYALRGGGGGTFGIATSAITKAHDVTPMSISSIAFSTSPMGDTPSVSHDVFWKGIRAYLKFAPLICDARGIGYNFINHGSTPDNIIFTAQLEMAKMSVIQTKAFAAPLIEELNNVGINITNPEPIYRTGRELTAPIGDSVGNTRLATRLLPRENLEDDDLLDKTTDAIRSFVEEGGYRFHGINYSPTEAIAGYPNNAVNPAFRKTAMHAEAFDISPAVGTLESLTSRYERFNSYFQPFRDVSPGAGSYMNEADVSEPDWQ